MFKKCFIISDYVSFMNVDVVSENNYAMEIQKDAGLLQESH